MARTIFATVLLGTGLALAGLHGAVAEGTPAQIVFQKHGHGESLSDDRGMTLYTYAKDEHGTPTCVGVCANTAPPLLVKGDAKAEGEWSIVARDDGSKQWAFHGRPLYFSARDVKPGDVNGEDTNGLWRVAFKTIPLPPGITITRTLVGYALSDARGLTLYALDKSTADGSNCDAACQRTWMPVLAPGMSHPVGDWTVATRIDGTHQWAFRGQPVYRNVNDLRVRDVETAAGWHPVVLEPLPPIPTWVTVQESDAGELLADAKGRTLYTFEDQRRTKDTPPHIPPEWMPLVADAGASGIAGWSVIDYLGNHQWAYVGLPLYVNKLDVVAGDILGIRSGEPRFTTIMRSGMTIEGTGH